MTHFKLILKYAFLDLKKQKIRTIFAIVGVLISIGVLTTVLFLSDSISSSYVDYLTIEAGNQDMRIIVRHYNDEPPNRSDYFKYDPIIDTIKDTTNAIGNFIPRMEVSGSVKISEGFNTTDLTDEVEWSTISAINFSLEKSINFGSFVDPNNNEEIDLDDLPLDHCAIYYGFNNIIKYSENDTIEVKMQLIHGNKTLNVVKNLTIDAIFNFNLKWPSVYKDRNLIVVSVNTLYEYFGYNDFKGRCSELLLTFKETNKLYDIRDFKGTELKVKEIANDIQLAIGIKNFYIDLPKLRVLAGAEFLSVFLVIVFIFVSIVAMLISGVLINGILKTSVEERIREFGIFRTLGANKRYNLAIVLMQGFLLCNFGTIAGILTADVVTRFLIIPFANSVISQSTIGFTDLTFSFTWWSILISYIMGISVGMIVSISPAIKVMRLQLIESIHPYRHEDTLYHLQKKSSVNYKLVLVGIILAFNGGFIFYIIPRIMVSSDMMLFAGTLIAILLIFNIGLTLAGLGLMPLILRLVIELFRPISRRLHNVIRIFVFRYQRRNSSTVIIFALSFSFVIFTSTTVNTLSGQVSAMTLLSYGSDIVIETTGWKEPEEYYEGDFGLFGSMPNERITEKNWQSTPEPSEMQILTSGIDPNRIMTIEFEENLLNIEGIERVSSVLAKPYQLTQVYSEAEKEFITEIGDYAGLSTLEITLIGIDEEYLFTIKNKYIEMTAGGMNNAFDNLFNNNGFYSCLISEAISVEMSLKFGDNIRIVIHRGDELEVYPFRIVGIAKSMPGFSGEFSASRMAASGGGVLISHETYIEIMDIPPVPYLDRIFIKLREDKISSAHLIENEIHELYRDDYNYEAFNLARMVAQQQSAFFVMDTLFTLITMTTVFICIFGLLSSSYSTIIERKKEIGIVRTLGLKGRDINRLFIIESLIVMISSGTIGIIIGWLSSWLVTSNLSTLIGMPDVIHVPWFNIILILSLSIIMIFIGMKLLLRKARKKQISDIYRETI